jgi:hypothetical protein
MKSRIQKSEVRIKKELVSAIQSGFRLLNSAFHFFLSSALRRRLQLSSEGL